MELLSVQEMATLAGNNASVVALYFLYRIAALLIEVKTFVNRQQSFNDSISEFIKDQKKFNKEISFKFDRFESAYLERQKNAS